jgi:hypothetical protein
MPVAGHVAVRVGKACGKASGDGIAARDEHDGDGPGCAMSGVGVEVRQGDYHIRLRGCQLLGGALQALVPPAAVTAVDGQVAAFHVTPLAQTVPQRLVCALGLSETEQAHPRDLLLLSRRRHRGKSAGQEH